MIVYEIVSAFALAGTYKDYQTIVVVNSVAGELHKFTTQIHYTNCVVGVCISVYCK